MKEDDSSAASAPPPPLSPSEADTSSHSSPPPSPAMALSPPPQDSVHHPIDAASSVAPPPSPTPPLSSPSPAKLTPSDFLPSVMLGEGSYSAVYLVERRGAPTERYAMKVLSKAHLQRYGRSHVAYAEKAALSVCDHPNVVRLFHTFQDAQSLYFVLELAEGGDVAALLDGRGGGEGLPLPLCRFFAAQLLWCLHYLHHSVHLLHRDVKPSNFLLSSTRQLKMADFGTAKLIDTTTPPPPPPPSHTALHTTDPPNTLPISSTSAPASSSSPSSSSPPPKKRSFVGTAAYVAPEMLSDGDVGFGVDQWSAGCSIYQMLTGSTPFDAPSEYLTFQRILTGEMSLPAGGMDPQALHLIRRLMERDPPTRLGCREEDWQEVEGHPFFEGIAWEAIKEGTAECPPLPSGPNVGKGKKWSVSEDSRVLGGWTNSAGREGEGNDEAEEEGEGDEGGGEEQLRGEAMTDVHLLPLPCAAVSPSLEEGELPPFPLRSATTSSLHSSAALQVPPRLPQSSTSTSTSSVSTSLPSSSASSAPSTSSSSHSSASASSVPLLFPSSVLQAQESLVLSSHIRPVAQPSSHLSSLCLPCMFSSTATSPPPPSSLLLLTSQGRLLWVEEEERTGSGAGGGRVRREWKVGGTEGEGGLSSPRRGGGGGKGALLRFVPSWAALPSHSPHLSPPSRVTSSEALVWEVLRGSSAAEWVQAVPGMVEGGAQ